MRQAHRENRLELVRRPQLIAQQEALVEHVGGLRLGGAFGVTEAPQQEVTHPRNVFGAARRELGNRRAHSIEWWVDSLTSTAVEPRVGQQQLRIDLFGGWDRRRYGGTDSGRDHGGWGRHCGRNRRRLDQLQVIGNVRELLRFPQPQAAGDSQRASDAASPAATTLRRPNLRNRYQRLPRRAATGSCLKY